MNMDGIVEIEITKPLPAEAVVESTYRIEGTVKVLGAVGAPPWVYAGIRYKEWYKPDWAEDIKYLKAWPVPITGDFSIKFKPEKEGKYEVTVIATPAPLSLPAVGLFPTLAESGAMEVSVGQRPPAVFRFSKVTIDGNQINLTDHDADSGLLISKEVTDNLSIIPSYEWVGPGKSATISIKAGYRDWHLGFSPKTEAYTRNIELPESPDTPYSGILAEPIVVPLIACGGLTDGALEVVLKISGEPDYISHIWNVYVTKVPEEEIDFDLTRPTASPSEVAPGNIVTITCPVISNCAKQQTITAKVKIYEGSIYAGHGTLITTKTTSPFSIAPGQSYDVIVRPTAIAGTIDRRDVEVEIYVGSELVKESEWDDIYYVTPEVELELLEVEIDPSGAGYVTVSPEPKSGTQHNWYFPHGTTVYVTAHPSSGYHFKSWSGEMTDTTDITAPVYPMTEKRTITAHFEREVTPEGTITRKELKYDSTQQAIPVSDVPKGTRGQVHIWGRNDTTIAQDLYIWWKVWDPDGNVAQQYNDWSYGHGPGNDHHFVGDRFDLSKSGIYTILAALFMNPDNPVEVDRYEGTLCTIEEVQVGIDFKVAIWGIPSDFGNYQKWWAYYFDPGINDFVSCGKWYNSYDKIPFSNVQAGGFFAVFLKKDSTISSQYNSPTFQAVDGGSYTYDVQYGRIYG